MRILIIAVLAAAAAWCGYWWYGVGTEEDAIRAWLDAREPAAYASVSTRGFPSRYDTTITEPVIPLGEFLWSAAFLQLLRTTYRPGQYTVVAANEQALSTQTQRIAMETESTRASLVLSDGAVERSVAILRDLRLDSDSGWVGQIEELRLSLQAQEDGTSRVGLEAEGLSIGDAPGFRLHADGSAGLDAEGFPEGVIELTASDWPAALDMAETLGWIQPDEAAPLRDAPGGTALTLTLEGGTAKLADSEMADLPELVIPPGE